MRAREFLVKEQVTAVDDAVRGARDAAAAAELATAGTQILPKVPAALKRVGAKVLPGVNVAYQGLDAVNRAKLGDPVGAGIATASAVPILAVPGTAVQAVRDKYRTGSFFPSDEEQAQAVARDRADRAKRPNANISDTPAP